VRFCGAVENQPRKLPTGTKRRPWYAIPEHVEKGVVIPIKWEYYSEKGVLTTSEKPPGIIKQDTSY
jgi:hypothetical protein